MDGGFRQAEAWADLVNAAEVELICCCDDIGCGMKLFKVKYGTKVARSGPMVQCHLLGRQIALIAKKWKL